MAIEDTLRALSGGEVAALAGDSTFVYANRYYEKNVTTGQETLYYWLGGRLVAVKRGGTLGYVHGDHLGSTSITTDAAGAQASALTYFPYGSGRASTGTVPTERKFTGQRLDGTGLYFYNARYYDAGLGRFISPDTLIQELGNPQSLNHYSYTINNPLKYIDPTGHCWGPARNLPGCSVIRQLLRTGTEAVVPKEGVKGVTFSVSLAVPVFVEVQVAVLVDSSGQVGLAPSVTVGGSTSVGGSVTLGVVNSNAPDVEALAGKSATSGGSASAVIGKIPVGAGVDVNLAKLPDSSTATTVITSGGVSASRPAAEVHGGATHTWVFILIDIYDADWFWY